MNLKISGLDEIVNKLSNVENSGLISKEALLSGGELLKEKIKNDAPVNATHSSKWHDHGRDFITSDLKLDTKTLKVVKVGLKQMDGSHWHIWKGLYYNHYGFTHNRSGKMVTKHLKWFDKSFKKHEKEVKEIIVTRLRRYINERL